MASMPKDASGLAPKELRSEIATARTDPHRWWHGDRILSEDAVLAQRGQGKGLWLYDELARDPKVGAALDKRKLALVGRTWDLEPADESSQAQQAVDLVRMALDGIAFNKAARALLDATLKGIAVAEVMWVVRDGTILPDRIIPRDPRRFAFRDVENQPPELRLLTREAPIDGIAVPARKFIVHRFGEIYGSPWGLGLGQRLFWPVFFKRQGIGFWMSAMEKFAAPTALGKYPPGTSEADQKKLLEAVAAVASEAAVIIPEGMMAELLEAKRSGAFDTYEKLARYMDEDVTLAVFGETLTSSAGQVGSQALGTVHDGVRLELIRADADLLSDTLNETLVRWLIEVNLPGAPPPRLWWDVAEPEDLNALATRDKTLADAGWTFTQERMEEVYGEGIIPKPKAEPPANAVAAPGAPAAAPASALGELFAEAKRAVQRRRMPKATPATDTVTDLAEQLATLAAADDEPLSRALTALVARSDTLQDVADGLVALLPEIRDDRLAELMAQTLAVANLAGRSDLADGI